MDGRKIKILEAIIRDYVKTGEPVGSRTIAKKYDLGISSATIRNEMADLEELGYIEQLHSSSGRIPSDRGYRLYVDKLMEVTDLSEEEKYFIKNKMLTSQLYQLDKVVSEATRLLSQLTNLACIANTPSLKSSAIKQIQLIGVDTTTVVVVLITNNGLISNKVIKIEKGLNPNMLQRLNYLINDRLQGLSVEDIGLQVINNLKEDLDGHEDIFNALIPALYDGLKEMESSKVYAEGTSNILNYPEYNDIEKAKGFFQFINNEENIRRILQPSPDTDNKSITINIGMENGLVDARDYSIITAVYGTGTSAVGAIGVIGPTRMDYDKVIATLDSLVKELNLNILQIYKK
ncbi:heat-inducible transcription repressor HrcA [Hathewaya proteolytica DSM 3090]|uniref:Heat-inducible transcription repressor HrcA n=1 Tax=Hathewaya proteolytica DSM 3090 TaxID=1121331 RepID=A0A1M6JHC8_9CLOT|nr:heat-inducible transcriptional repressor HrcA [Hathewaya proteolytica]SHJ46081.1 heat-inducible transcription repressor HrcA [Hathewaya proteolytica DSM 3090]